MLRFEYAYVGLPALDAEPYATGENLIGVALSTLMRVTPERRSNCTGGPCNASPARATMTFASFCWSSASRPLFRTGRSPEAKPASLVEYRTLPGGKTLHDDYLRNAVRSRDTERIGAAIVGGKVRRRSLPNVKQRASDLAPERLLQLQLRPFKAQTLKELKLEVPDPDVRPRNGDFAPAGSFR